MHRIKMGVAAVAHDAWVELDGKRLEGVVGVSFNYSIDEPNIVCIRLHADVEIEGEMEARVE